MNRQHGFTMVELLVVVGIMGILFVSAVPLYRTWQQRAYGSEAAIMLNQLINAEIAYFLENDEFFPPDIDYYIPHEGATTPAGVDVIQEIEDNLNIIIRQGHFLEYTLRGVNSPGNESFVVTIQSKDKQFELFKGTDEIYANLDKNGKVEFVYPSY